VTAQHSPERLTASRLLAHRVLTPSFLPARQADRSESQTSVPGLGKLHSGGSPACETKIAGLNHRPSRQKNLVPGSAAWRMPLGLNKTETGYYPTEQ